MWDEGRTGAIRDRRRLAETELMKTRSGSMSRFPPVLLREMPLDKSYIRNARKQEAGKSRSFLTIRLLSVIAPWAEVRGAFSPTF